MIDVRKWRGLKALVQDAVEHGSRAVEQVHIETARRPFAILERIPAVAGPSRAVRSVHDAAVATTYGAVRVVNRLVASTLDVALDAVDRGQRQDAVPTLPPVELVDREGG